MPTRSWKVSAPSSPPYVPWEPRRAGACPPPHPRRRRRGTSAGKRLVVFVEIDRCATDAVRVLTGVRLGKRTLKHLDYGKMAATFADVVTGGAVRVSARAERGDREPPARPGNVFHTPKYRHGSHTTPIDTNIMSNFFGPFGDMYRRDKRAPHVGEAYIDINDGPVYKGKTLFDAAPQGEIILGYLPEDIDYAHPNIGEDDCTGLMPRGTHLTLPHMQWMFYLPRICNHCTYPACASACPRQSIYERPEDGIVLLDQSPLPPSRQTRSRAR